MPTRQPGAKRPPPGRGGCGADWPVTIAIMLVAFGSLVAAGLPLMLKMVGLMAAAGTL